MRQRQAELGDNLLPVRREDINLTKDDLTQRVLVDMRSTDCLLAI